jgi:hypothetical protein
MFNTKKRDRDLKAIVVKIAHIAAYSNVKGKEQPGSKATPAGMVDQHQHSNPKASAHRKLRQGQCP